MIGGLNGRRVAVLETRMSRELARLVERYGGEPVCVPAVREVSMLSDEIVTSLLDELAEGAVDVVVFLTGVSVSLLFEGADGVGRRADLIAALRRVTTVCRGPKPMAALRGFGVPVTLSAREPYTTGEVLEALSTVDIAERSIVVLHHGERNATLSETLRAQDARVRDVSLYVWDMPEDTGPLQDLVSQVIAGTVDAVTFTCQVHVHHLFRIADETRRRSALRDALTRNVIVASVGPTCTAALESYGVRPHVVPEHPKLGPMVAALARHLAANRTEAAI